jgi:phenylalanyl-tRNA synthetase beta chain
MSDAMYFPGRAATIYYRAPGANKTPGVVGQVKKALSLSTFHDAAIGSLGVLHPSVLEKFEIGYPCSALEFTLEPFTKELQQSFATEVPETLGKPTH